MGECGRGLLAHRMLYIKVKTSKWPKHAILTGMIRLSIVVKLTGLMGHAMWMTVARLLQGGCPLLVARYCPAEEMDLALAFLYCIDQGATGRRRRRIDARLPISTAQSWASGPGLRGL